MFKLIVPNYGCRPSRKCAQSECFTQLQATPLDLLHSVCHIMSSRGSGVVCSVASILKQFKAMIQSNSCYQVNVSRALSLSCSPILVCITVEKPTHCCSSASRVYVDRSLCPRSCQTLTPNAFHLLPRHPSRSCLIRFVYCSFCLGDGLAQLVLCEDGTTCMDISSLGKGEPERLTPLSWEITGADITYLIASCIGEKRTSYNATE